MVKWEDKDQGMKVLLIRPPVTLFANEMKLLGFPLGLAYVAASLETSGIQVEVLDALAATGTGSCFGPGRHAEAAEGDRPRDKVDRPRDEMIHCGMDWPDIEQHIRHAQPEVVGINCMFTSQARNAYEVAALAKRVDPKITVVMGGAHASSVPEEVLARPEVDWVVLGEGESTLPKALASRGDPAELREIAGFGCKIDHQVIINHQREYIPDLDQIPLPAWHLFPMDRYLNTEMSHGPDLMRRPLASMITSRGCPCRCVYCSVHTVWGRSYRPRSPKNVVDEIELLVRQYGVREIHFEDDNLTLQRDRLIAICKEIITRGLDIKWMTPNGVFLLSLDREVLGWMKKAGCYKLCFGIESGDPETQKFIHKRVPLDRCKRIVKEANRLGIWTHGFFILGFPFETREAIHRTLAYAIESDLDFASFFLAVPYPHTELSQIMKDHGMLDHAGPDLRAFGATVDTKYLTREELSALQRTMYKRFAVRRVMGLLNPVKLSYRLRRLKSLEDWRLMIRYLKRFLQIVK